MSRNDAMREARLRKGLSQQALAEQLGVSRQTIIAIESGETVAIFRNGNWAF